MTISEAVRNCFGKYVTFSGRAGRPEFWKFVLFLIVTSLVLSIIDGLLFGPSMTETAVQTTNTDGNVTTMHSQSRSYGNGPLASLFSLATFLPFLAVSWRRLHDTGRPGWYMFAPLLVSIAVMLFFFTGIFGVSMMENAGVAQDTLRGPATAVALTGMVVGIIGQLVFTILLIWWMSRPSETQGNAYGPEPQ